MTKSESEGFAYSPMRDMKAKPYTDAEKRVADYLTQLTDNQIGGGEDPIGFLMASHAYLVHERAEVRRVIREACDHLDLSLVKGSQNEKT